MSVIEASTVSVKTMADDTLRLTVDIEPRHAKAAFELFGSRGTAVALAAIKSTPDAPVDKPKGGQLAKLAGIWCADARFQEWIGADDEDDARQMIYNLCGIKSRAELDHDKQAEAVFHKEVRIPYSEWIGNDNPL